MAYKNAPELTRIKEMPFNIDGEVFTLHVPAGGQEGRYSVYDVTSAGEERYQHLLTLAYDLQVASNKYYSMTHVLFGLTKDGCCTVEEAKGYQVSVGKKNRNSWLREINGKQTLYVESDQAGGKFVAKYFVPFNDSYNFFYILWIDEEVKKDIDFVSIRLEMLEDMVKFSGFLDVN